MRSFRRGRTRRERAKAGAPAWPRQSGSSTDRGSRVTRRARVLGRQHRIGREDGRGGASEGSCRATVVAAPSRLATRARVEPRDGRVRPTGDAGDGARAAARPDGAQPRGAHERRGDVGLAQAGEARDGGRCDLRHHRGGHPALRRPHDSRRAPPRARRAGGTHRRQQVGDRHPRIREPAGALGARADRRAERLHAALRGDVLGGAGHAPRGHRAHRGGPRSGRHLVGGERRQRRDQHHHQACARHPGPLRHRRRRQRGSGIRRRALRRQRR